MKRNKICIFRGNSKILWFKHTPHQLPSLKKKKKKKKKLLDLASVAKSSKNDQFWMQEVYIYFILNHEKKYKLIIIGASSVN